MRSTFRSVTCGGSSCTMSPAWERRRPTPRSTRSSGTSAPRGWSWPRWSARAWPCAGAVLQTVVANPLADPIVLGFSYGATLGAVLVITLGGGAALAGLGVSAAAFLGAIAAGALVFALGQRRGRLAPTRLVLAGVAVGYVFLSATSYVQLQATPDRVADGHVLDARQRRRRPVGPTAHRHRGGAHHHHAPHRSSADASTPCWPATSPPPRSASTSTGCAPYCWCSPHC